MTEVVITNGASEGGFACMQALVNPGDQVIMFEPFYDAYPAWVSMAGGEPVYVPLREPTPNNTDTIDDARVHQHQQDLPLQRADSWILDMKELEQSITSKTKMIVLNTPQNPLGKVFSVHELQQIADLAIKHDLIVISDEVYDRLIFDNVYVFDLLLY
jgi:kynurenine aminotransferase